VSKHYKGVARITAITTKRDYCETCRWLLSQGYALMEYPIDVLIEIVPWPGLDPDYSKYYRYVYNVNENQTVATARLPLLL